MTSLHSNAGQSTNLLRKGISAKSVSELGSAKHCIVSMMTQVKEGYGNQTPNLCNVNEHNKQCQYWITTGQLNL